MRYRFSDLKRATGGAGHAPFKADMLGYDNYYPFGMMPEDRRSTALTGGIGRYGYNGKEMDNELNDRNGAGDGTANSYDYGFRMYEPRLGKFLSEDPLTADYPELTPYQYASNRPIDAIDLDGLEAEKYVTQYFAPDGRIARTWIRIYDHVDVINHSTNLSVEEVLNRLLKYPTFGDHVVARSG